MIVLALDMATVTGWCCGDITKGRPVLGRIKLPSTGKNLGRFMNAAMHEYRELIEHTHPDRIIYESPILRSSQTQIIILRKLYGLAGVIEMIAEDAKLPINEVSLTSVKKTLTGNGRAKKHEMIAAAEAKGMNPADDNEADAFGIWLHTAKHFAPEEALRFEKDLLI